MRKVKRIDTLSLSFPLWVKEYEETNKIIGRKMLMADGSTTIFTTEAINPQITLISKRNEFVSEAEKDALESLYFEQREFEIEYMDGYLENVIFDYSIPPKYEPLWLGARYYYPTLTFLRSGDV
jgi:hypothetical protein